MTDETVYHTVNVTRLAGDEYLVTAMNNDVTDDYSAPGVGIGRDGDAVGIMLRPGNSLRFDRAESGMTVERVEFDDDALRPEIHIRFSNEDRS